MPTATMPWPERVENFTRHLLRTKPGTILSITGSTGRGKTRLLRDVASDLSKRDMIPLYLAPPPRDEDTAGAALATAADTLKTYKLLNGQTATLKDVRAPRGRKIDIVLEGMRKAPNSVVLLLDEPARWVGGEWSGESSAAGRRFTLRVCQELATKSGCRVVFTGGDFGIPAGEEPYRLPKAWNESDLPRSLTDHHGWTAVSPDLAAFAADLTPLHYRMLTMLAALSTPAEAVEAARDCVDVSALASRLAVRSADRGPLRRAWACFAAVRTTITGQLYERLASDLPPDLRGLAEDVLLTAVEGGYELHPLLADAIDPRKVLGPEYRDVQRLLAEQYLGNPSSLAAATEAYFHATEAGDDALVEQAQPFFVEQLHLRGRSLSRQKRHREAADVFRRAVELDPEDDYAHHYRAFNLDWVAGEPPTIEGAYRRAIELNPQHPWWHSRWINYLVTVGRTADARAAFAAATEALRDATAAHPDYVYTSVHLWVAALLLRRAQLDFARQVLERVPAELRREHLGFVALGETLTALEEARRGRGVFPLSVRASEHWRQAPHLDFPPHVSGDGLQVWHPARVEAISGEGVTLVVGKRPERGQPPTYGRVVLPAGRFDAASLDGPAANLRPGRFLELGFYGDAGVLRIRSHPLTEWEDPDLPFLNPPDTLRYLRKLENAQ